MFGGEEFGPYKTEREAKLFAIEAAFKLGEQGERTEVLVSEEAGAVAPVWVYVDSTLIRRAHSAQPGEVAGSGADVLQDRSVCANRAWRR